MGTWSPRRATGWYGTPGLAVNDHGLVMEACDDVLNGTILPLVNRPVFLSLAPPQLCN